MQSFSSEKISRRTCFLPVASSFTLFFLLSILCLFFVLTIGCKGKPNAAHSGSADVLPDDIHIVPMPEKTELDKVGLENDLDIRWVLPDALFLVTGQPKQFFESPLGQGNEALIVNDLNQLLRVPFNLAEMDRFVLSFAPGITGVEVDQNGTKSIQPGLVLRRSMVFTFHNEIQPENLLAPVLQDGITLDSLRRKLGNVEYFNVADPGKEGPIKVAMHFAGPKTVVLIESFEEDLKTVFEATTPMGAVGLRAKRLDLSACDIAFVASREGLPVNEMILERFLAFFRQIPQNVAEQLARNFRAITISIRTGTNVGQSMLDAHFEAMDEKGAAEVNELFLGLVIGAQTTLAALDEPSRQMLPFSIEFAQSALGAMKTEAEGRAVRFTIDKFVGFDQALLSGINQQKTTMQQVRMAQAKFDQLAMLQRYFLAYYQQNKKIPSTLRSEDGKPLLSWRVALLPIMGRQDLFDRFKLDEPWDSESNKALLNSMPPIFQMFGITADETALKTKTAIRMFVSEGTPLADPSLKLEEIKNPQGMMLFAYVMPDFACEWTKPEDMNWNVDKIDAYFGNALMAVSMNGAVDAIPIIPKDSEQANERVAEQRRFIDGFVRGQLLPTAMTEPDASKSESTVQEINKE